MAGKGKRMRPHTLTTAKPLIPVGGKPVVQRLVEDITRVCGEKVTEIAYVIHPSFGKEVEANLIKVAEGQGAKGSIHYQEETLGTAHAIMCAKQALHDKTVVAFADTLFKADFVMDTTREGVIWVQQIPDPSQFGVVKIGADGNITDFVEKPKEFVSDLAIIGIYYFKDGDNLRNELQYLLDNNIREKGEYQLTNALENMKAKGVKFYPGQVTEWLDCGNKNATVETHGRWLQLNPHTNTIGEGLTSENAVVVQPCFIGNNVKLRNSVIGPNVSIADGTSISNSVVQNSIIQKNTSIQNSVIDNAMIGSHTEINGSKQSFSLGDYSTLKNE